jgi:lipoic acid synthetase
MSCVKMDPALHQAQKPPWIKVRLPSSPVFFSTKALISDLRLHTVCESAQCPNRWECWSQGTATMMIAGDRCTRACGFCAVTTAKPYALEKDEPQRVAEAVRRMKLKHVVITAVARDDLKDGGADHFPRTSTAVKWIPGDCRSPFPIFMRRIVHPDCADASQTFTINMETVERLTRWYARAQNITSLKCCGVPGNCRAIVTKSGAARPGEKETELFRRWTTCVKWVARF